MSYPVRGEEPVVVEALKMRALPRMASGSQYVGSLRWP
jgi:hypothetical protein